MQQMNPVNPALANLLQVANMVTPEQTPTVAAQVASAAEQKFAPAAMTPPSVQSIAQDAGIGNQVQMQQQQAQQQQMMQALQQLMQQRQSQDNAMRFGVAAAPGAQRIQGMADGGIVGYAAGDQVGIGLESDWLSNLVDRLRGKKAERQPPAPPAPVDLGPVPGTGEGDVLGGRPGTLKGSFGPESTEISPPPALAPTRAPARPPVAAAPIAAPQAQGPSKADEYLTRAEKLAGEYETEAPSPEKVGILAGKTAEARDAYLRSRGVNPEQYKQDIEASQAREKRKLEGIEKLAAESKAAREGLPGLIRLLSAAGGRTNPLQAIGVQYGNQVAEQLADNERFMNARERVMDSEAAMQAAIRDKRRAEAMGDFKAADDAATKERDARNEQRKAQITLATEAAKLISGKEEKALDRQTETMLTKMRIDAQDRMTAATREGTLETRRATIVAGVNRDEDRAMAAIDNNYNKRLSTLGVLPGVKPTAEQTKALQEAQAEREAAQAAVRAKAAETRAMVMGGSGGGGIKVERLK